MGDGPGAILGGFGVAFTGLEVGNRYLADGGAAGGSHDLVSERLVFGSVVPGDLSPRCPDRPGRGFTQVPGSADLERQAGSGCELGPQVLRWRLTPGLHRQGTAR